MKLTGTNLGYHRIYEKCIALVKVDDSALEILVESINSSNLVFMLPLGLDLGYHNI